MSFLLSILSAFSKLVASYVVSGLKATQDYLDKHPIGFTASGGVVLGLTAINTFDLLLKLCQVLMALGGVMLLGTNIYRKWYGKKKLKKPVIELLLVDDDENDQQLFSRSFSLVGCHVTAVMNLREAMDFLRSPAKCDMILLDAKIPGEDTEHMFRSIKTVRPLTPCAIFTGQSSPEMEKAINSISPGTAFFIKERASEHFAANIIETLRLGAPH